MTEEHAEEQKLGPFYSPWAKAFSFILGILSSVFILVWPQHVARDLSELDHSFLSLVMLAMSGCFVHGVGFIPKNVIGRWLFSPYVCWPVVAIAAWQWLS